MKLLTRLLLIVLLAVFTAAGQEQAGQESEVPQHKTPTFPIEAIHIQDVKIDFKEGYITWIVTTGMAEASGKFRGTAPPKSYSVSIRDRIMRVDGEKRRFSEQEQIVVASQVSSFFEGLKRYAVSSTIWWQDGNGEPVRRSVSKETTAEE
ncbi:MAG: hypothetical protein COT91_04805 [Candidatus Doudnabacteria bacterium CG10_big_fil_rev_8_21_14_0_10_41_10]|uniref:Uncharacterized protein n=1 Tax=Candidatus Doudnabacteria bacterium CG10_big_fil_rev_8_21_14_0_10_41_10 TaxID=1974551 RepID=A0A2H0VCG4_9BACT|nr:MAG: hypothetical protein COT91_04805 [Candidatus Doudnabacteria bacterium CG10_big_fil_rev_8_21_14_0_10_41_10]